MLKFTGIDVHRNTNNIAMGKELYSKLGWHSVKHNDNIISYSC